MKAIVAIAENNVIGNKNTLPWQLPEDLKWFKKATKDSILIMGRKTFESLGKPLSGRESYVISRSDIHIPGAHVIHTIEDILALNKNATKPIWVIGGAEIYKLFLPFCSELYITHIKGNPEGDTYFPDYEPMFVPKKKIQETPEFKIVCYQNVTLKAPITSAPQK